MNANNNFSTAFEEMKNNKIAMLPKWSNVELFSAEWIIKDRMEDNNE